MANEWVETRKKFQFQMCVWVVARLRQRLKLTFFEIFSSLKVPFGDPLLEKVSKNVDFSLWGKHCIVLPKWTFFHVLANIVYTYLKIWSTSKWRYFTPWKILSSAWINILITPSWIRLIIMIWNMDWIIRIQELSIRQMKDHE